MEALVTITTALAVAVFALWAWRRSFGGADDRAGQDTKSRIASDPSANRGDERAVQDSRPVELVVDIASGAAASLAASLGQIIDATIESVDKRRPSPGDRGADGRELARSKQLVIATCDGEGALDAVLAELGARGYRVNAIAGREIVLLRSQADEARVELRDGAALSCS